MPPKKKQTTTSSHPVPAATQISGGIHLPFSPQQTPTIPSPCFALPVCASGTEVNDLALPGSSQSSRAGTPAIPTASITSNLASASSSSAVPATDGHVTSRGEHDQVSEGRPTAPLPKRKRTKAKAVAPEVPVLSSASSSVPPAPPPIKKVRKSRTKKAADTPAQPVALNNPGGILPPVTPQPTATIPAPTFALPVSAAVTQMNASGLALPGSSQSWTPVVPPAAIASSSSAGPAPHGHVTPQGERDEEDESESTIVVPRVDKGKGKAVDPEPWDSRPLDLEALDCMRMPPPPVPQKAFQPVASTSRKRKNSQINDGQTVVTAPKRARNSKNTNQAAANNNLALVAPPTGARPYRARGNNPERLYQYPGPGLPGARIAPSVPGATGFASPRLINHLPIVVGIQNTPWVPGNYLVQTMSGWLLLLVMHCATIHGLVLPGVWYYCPWTGNPHLVILLPRRERTSNSQGIPGHPPAPVLEFTRSSPKDVRRDQALVNAMYKWQMNAGFYTPEQTMTDWERMFGNGRPHPGRILAAAQAQPEQQTNGESTNYLAAPADEYGLPPVAQPQSEYDALNDPELANYAAAFASSSAGPSRTGDGQQQATAIAGPSNYNDYSSSNFAGTNAAIASGSGQQGDWQQQVAGPSNYNGYPPASDFAGPSTGIASGSGQPEDWQQQGFANDASAIAGPSNYRGYPSSSDSAIASGSGQSGYGDSGYANLFEQCQQQYGLSNETQQGLFGDVGYGYPSQL